MSSGLIIRICYNREIKINTSRKLCALPGARLPYISLRSVNKILAAKTALLSTSTFPAFYTLLFIFTIMNKN
ncbi:unnamed protein product [Schistosoma curassoni]|uniref:Uncharacterized protein n=1 Tax=Schistosoma curassoni TaxID=6186 RepID=A0A183L392_9TREM|nr:unnamed protein product [Schistosoma curassoni]